MIIVNLFIANTILCLFGACKELPIQSLAHIEGLKGSELALTWDVGKGNDLVYSQLFLGEKVNSSKILFENDDSHPTLLVRGKFGDRISARATGRTYQVKIKNLKYDDIGSFTLQAIVRTITKKKVDWVDYIKTIKITKINGPPELKGNISSETELTFVVSGVPAPKLYWGFNKNEITKSIPHKGNKNNFYIKEYSLHFTKDMCGKTIYFKANGYKSHVIRWNGKPKFKCVSPVQYRVATTPGKNVALTWTVCKASKDDLIKSLKVYRGSMKNDTNLLLKNNEFPTKYANEMFEERLLHAQVKQTLFKITYKVKLLSAQYSDAGSFYFEAVFVNKTTDTVYIGGKITLLIKDRLIAKRKPPYYNSYIWVASGVLVFVMAIAFIIIALRRIRKSLRIERSRLRESQSSSQNESDTSQQINVPLYTEINRPQYVEINVGITVDTRKKLVELVPKVSCFYEIFEVGLQKPNTFDGHRGGGVQLFPFMRVSLFNDENQNGSNNNRPYYENMLPAINKYNVDQGYELPVNYEYLKLINESEESKYINRSQVSDFCRKLSGAECPI